MPSKSTLHLIALAALCVFAELGCRTATVPDSILPRLSNNDPQAQLEYWHTLARRPLISNDEAFHGILLYLDNADHATSYQQRVEQLKSRKLIPQNFHEPSNQAFEYGTLAVTLVRTLNIKGGLTMRLTGPTPHYATRELQYRGVYPQSSENQVFSGLDFVSVIGKAEDYRRGDPTSLPASTVSAEATAEDDDPPTDAIMPLLAMIAPEPGDLSLQPTTSAPASRPAGPMKVVITAVDGPSTVRADESAQWALAKKGMELSEKAEFRTGPRSSVQLKIAPDQVVLIERLTTITVLKAVQSGNKVTTDIGMPYGRTKYDLEGGGLEHQSTLRSPNATLAVRGTKVSLFDSPPFAPQAISLTGRAEFRAFRRRAIAFGNKGQGRTVVNDASLTAGDLALSQTVVDPTLQGARTESEAALLTTLISRGANVQIDRSSGIRIVTGGFPPTDAQLVPALPGRLDFVLRWDGNANLDLGVATPATEKNPGGEFIYPAAGLNISPSGATAFDHRGGPHGGIEVVYFNTVTDGVYALAGPSLTKGVVVNATLDAFFDGKHIPLFYGTQVNQIQQQVSAPFQPALGQVFINTPTPDFPARVQSRTARPAVIGPMPLSISQKK